MDATDLGEDPAKKLVSLVEQEGEKMNDDHKGNADICCICHQRDDTLETVESPLSQVATISLTHATTGHKAKRETSTLD